MVQIPLTADSEITAFGRDLGAGTAFPASGPAGTSLRRGDVCFRTDYGGLFVWTGAAWRQRGPCELTNAQRLALATAGLHVDFRVWETDKLREWLWNGAAWIPLLGEDWALVPVAANMTQNNLVPLGDGAAGPPGPPGWQYRREGDRVFFRGVAFANVAVGNDVLIATMPAGYRPVTSQFLMVWWEITGAKGTTRLNLGTGGGIYAKTGLSANTYCFFDGLSFALTG